MDKLKLAEWGEKIKTGGAQMSRMVSGKVKEILQTPTPESKMVDEATSEALEEPNWGMNMRICAMINSGEFNGPEIVRAIKKKICGKSVVSQRLSLDLLEACTMNCEKVFSEVSSEKVLDDMVRIIENPLSDQGNRNRALQLIRAWGESEDLAYLPIFRQTYISLKNRRLPQSAEEVGSPPDQQSLESYIHQEPVLPPESYPIPDAGFPAADERSFAFNYGNLSADQKKEFISVTRNSLDLLSSLINTETEPKPIKDDLTVSMLEKCKESQPVIQRIIESTIDDEGMLFEALSLHDELQQVISRYEEMEAALEPKGQHMEDTDNSEGEPRDETKALHSTKEHSPKQELRDKTMESQSSEEHSPKQELRNKTMGAQSNKGEGTVSNSDKKDDS